MPLADAVAEVVVEVREDMTLVDVRTQPVAVGDEVLWEIDESVAPEKELDDSPRLVEFALEVDVLLDGDGG